MSLLPEFQIGWLNGWWYPAVFGLINLGLIAAYGPRTFGKRLLHLPAFTSPTERILSLASVFLFGRGMMIYSIFVTIKWDTPWFYIGTALFLAGLTIYTRALVNFAVTPPDRPVVSGVYRFSRHPIQFLGIVMWIGVGIAVTSWVILIACVIQLFLSRPFILAQERFCLDAYGESYREYMQKTPRYFAWNLGDR
jgi:protein-S-isoprenylcysteine O-methyltransferase Ste14